MKKFKTGDESIKGTNQKLLDYWRWGYSNVLVNRERGIFAEFLVGNVLGELDNPRIE